MKTEYDTVTLLHVLIITQMLAQQYAKLGSRDCRVC